MSHVNTIIHSLTQWLQQTRHQSTPLDNEADAILVQLHDMMQSVQHIDSLSSQPLSLGLYGHSLASKKQLLTALLCSSDGALWVMSGEQKIDYFSQINPGRQQADMAIRFTPATLPVTNRAPLLLTLYSESEFAQRLIYRYQCSISPAESTVRSLYSGLKEVRLHAGLQPLPGMTSTEAMAAIATYQLHTPPAQHLSTELNLQIAELLPLLSRMDRAQLLAPLWGNNPALTSAWIRHAEILQQMGGATQVLAPATLLTDTFRQPFLFAAQNAQTGERETQIFPLHNARPQAAQSLLITDLASACAEVVVSLDSASPHNIEIVDIPPGQLNYYAEHLQPDTLLVCNAARQHQEVQQAAQLLLHWLKRTQADNASGRPRLIWAIAPTEASARLRQADNSVQRIITRAREEWATLQLFDSDNMQPRVEWLKEGISLSGRNARQSALLQVCVSELNALFAHLIREPLMEKAQREQQVRGLIKKLQNHIDRHGDLLAALDLPHGLLLQYQALYSQKQSCQLYPRTLVIDLFAEPQTLKHETVDGQDFAALVHKAWVNHLRQLTPQHPLLKAIALEPSQLRVLCRLLISFSYRYDLSAALRDRLKQTEECPEAEVACASAAIGDFITWLGYAGTASQERPLSRVNSPAAIFTPVQQASVAQRLTQLKPRSLNQGTRWAYDWLVALYSRIKEQDEAGYAYGLSHPQLEAVRAALMETRLMNPSPCANPDWQPGCQPTLSLI